MDDECSPFNWDSYYHEEGQGIEELKHTLLYTLELESAIACAHEEISRKGDEVLHFKCLLTKTVKERDEAQLKYQELVLENMILQQKIQELESCPTSFAITTPTGYIEDDHLLGVDSSSGSDDNYVGTPRMEIKVPLPPTDQQPKPELTDKVVLTKGLPENGKFLQAVVEAGPLLQTLLLAGPLPQWQHPPPQLNSIEIPPVTIPSTPTTNTPTPTSTTVPRMLLHQDSCVSTIISGGNNNCGGGLITRKRSFEQCSEDDYKPYHLHQKPKGCSPIIIDQKLVF
ncbi:hypothetical protein HanRHA438_Chr09g0390931 [Helianthus annuus]|uniref:Uncharacterized protein n=1 Tax=Helianthus annuus TaxID=4232 RepID=A0A251TUC7_HELAN|nr:uncharacterized protein LOC110877834 [Helianthus annuus]XP_021982194.2 uncharacterized protein LOC110878234 [Helianthus annuus]KAF5790110.1 hypothetical protein HanXRQr2_Chr09g0379251 [Helianthus annuus]KAJ0533479.1 hypothetical protein HanIR_Chr09g0408851 [Helianthus annuus]KAJ0541765.1 hypothetical protein HanHA89_Chr09g0332221 [Helianthus annuus]KAJ0706841.1 hypothetical protein HanLR1_Chr09g0311671 [Helianthus annuus]KAJ0710865.1 hypothetical protein HanOQP8_Chr09g0317301 [Helianthus a